MTEFPKMDSGLVVPVFTQRDDPIAYLNKAMAFLTTIASSRQCTQPKRLRNAAWFKDKAMLAEAQESGQILDEEQLTEDLDAYDSDCDDVSNAKAVLITNLSNYGSDVISEVPHFEPYHNDMDNQNFGKRFLLQQELSSEQAFWLQTSNPNTEQSDILPSRIEAPSELPKDIMLSVMNSTSPNGESVNLEMQSIESCDKCFDLDAEFLKTQNAYNELVKSYSQLGKHCIYLELTMQLNQEIFQKDKSWKEIIDNAAQIPSATTIVPGMFKLDLDPLAPRLLKNKEARIDYLKHTQEQADILRGIVEQAKAKQPLDNALDFACKHAKRIQELLVYVRDTCPNVCKPNEKLVVVTPMNKVKKVKFSEPLTSSSNIHKEVESSKTSDSNTPVFPSTRLKSSSSACR
nr:hypothetical protein [Tanacetum cinerariifolium]